MASSGCETESDEGFSLEEIKKTPLFEGLRITFGSVKSWVEHNGSGSPLRLCISGFNKMLSGRDKTILRKVLSGPYLGNIQTFSYLLWKAGQIYKNGPWRYEGEDWRETGKCFIVLTELPTPEANTITTKTEEHSNPPPIDNPSDEIPDQPTNIEIKQEIIEEPKQETLLKQTFPQFPSESFSQPLEVKKSRETSTLVSIPFVPLLKLDEMNEETMNRMRRIPICEGSRITLGTVEKYVRKKGTKGKLNISGFNKMISGQDKPALERVLVGPYRGNIQTFSYLCWKASQTYGMVGPWKYEGDDWEDTSKCFIVLNYTSIERNPHKRKDESYDVASKKKIKKERSIESNQQQQQQQINQLPQVTQQVVEQTMQMTQKDNNITQDPKEQIVQQMAEQIVEHVVQKVVEQVIPPPPEGKTQIPEWIDFNASKIQVDCWKDKENQWRKTIQDELALMKEQFECKKNELEIEYEMRRNSFREKCIADITAELGEVAPIELESIKQKLGLMPCPVMT